MTIQLPLWMVVSIKRFWMRPPEMRFLLFAEDKTQPVTVNAAVNWEYDEPSRLLPFVSVTVSDRGGMGKESIKASVEKKVQTLFSGEGMTSLDNRNGAHFFPQAQFMIPMDA